MLSGIFQTIIPASPRFVAALFVWQQFLMRARDRAGSFAAFRNNNWVGGVVFLGILAAYLVS